VTTTTASWGTADDETIYGDAGGDILTAEATGTDAPSR